ncbi:hypothetical protein [Horticoccus sp. 23ND18S-11]|uniref:hypothetical protein n=1 Tax=Horticoccus sp. 23ND18S-11 TaxID=3391832 RepID=UPI0039C8DEFD
MNIEKWVLVGLLALGYLTRVPGLVRQGWIGAPALVVGLLISGTLIVLLLRSSARAALIVACLAALGGIVAPLVQVFVLPMISKMPPAPLSMVAISASISLIAGFCAMDLWSEWKKKA